MQKCKGVLSLAMKNSSGVSHSCLGLLWVHHTL